MYIHICSNNRFILN